MNADAGESRSSAGTGTQRTAEGHVGPMRNRYNAGSVRHLVAPYPNVPQQLMLNKRSQQAPPQTVCLHMLCLWCEFIVMICLFIL